MKGYMKAIQEVLGRTASTGHIQPEEYPGFIVREVYTVTDANGRRVIHDSDRDGFLRPGEVPATFRGKAQ
jgi:hypothetical protein